MDNLDNTQTDNCIGGKTTENWLFWQSASLASGYRLRPYWRL